MREPETWLCPVRDLPCLEALEDVTALGERSDQHMDTDEWRAAWKVYYSALR